MIHPDLSADDWMVAAFRALRAGQARPIWADTELELPYFALLTYRLPLDVIHQVCKRLRVQRRTVDDLEHIQSLRGQLPLLAEPIRPSQVDAILSGSNDRVLLTTWAAASDAAARAHVVEYAERLRFVRPYTDGEALKALGLEAGPPMGTILRTLRTAWLDGEIAAEVEEQAFLAHLLAEEIQNEANAR
jgi:hypothetical protein